MNFLLCLALSYLAGSIPTGFLVARWVKGIDIQKHGSGNLGATNVFRVVGKKWGLGVLLFDMFKGILAAYVIPTQISNQYAGSFFTTSLIFGLAAIVGHTWTIWLRFHGGKGVATTLGVLLALMPRAAGVALLIWFLLFIWKRYVSLASLGMALSLPFGVFLFYRKEDFFWSLLSVSLVLAVFIFYTHRSNLKRLREGSEKNLF